MECKKLGSHIFNVATAIVKRYERRGCLGLDYRLLAKESAYECVIAVSPGGHESVRIRQRSRQDRDRPTHSRLVKRAKNAPTVARNGAGKSVFRIVIATWHRGADSLAALSVAILECCMTSTNAATGAPDDVTIIGAGIGGLALALALGRLRQPSVVFEAKPVLGEAGAGISMPPNALKILWRLGLQQTLAPLLSVPDCGEIRRGETGELLATTPFGEPLIDRYGAPFAQIHRADLHTTLLDAAMATGMVEMRAGTPVESVRQENGFVELGLHNGEFVRSPAVAACDGIRSRVREHLFDMAPARFTRHVAWRCLIPMQELPDYLRQRRSIVHLADHRQLVHYPVRDMTLLNCVAFVGDTDWSIESWSEPGDPEELRRAFDAFGPGCKTVLSAIPPSACHRWAIYDREPIPTFNDGRVALVGDAAHPMPPYLGQGAAMAIEDAFVLATVLHQYDDVATAFAEYTALRLARANNSVAESRAAGRRFQEPGADAERFDGDQALRANVMFDYEPQSPLTAH